MAEISKLSGVSWANIAYYAGKSKNSIGKITKGINTPSPLSQADYLLGWWDPSDASVNDTTLDNRTYTNSVGVTSNLNHYQGGMSGTETHITNLNGVNCWYLDGSGDRVYTYNINTTGTNWPLTTNFVEWTIEGWLRSNGSWIGNGNWWNLGYNSAYRNRFTTSGNLWNYPKTSKQTSETFATNTWWHITVTMSALPTNSSRFGTLTVYKNGQQMQQWTNINQDPSQSGRTNFWGGFTSTGESGRFYMGIHRIYNIPLTTSEVANNYNLEKSTYGY